MCDIIPQPFVRERGGGRPLFVSRGGKAAKDADGRRIACGRNIPCCGRRGAFGFIALVAFITGPVCLFRTGDLPWWLWGLAMYALSLWSVLRVDFREEDFAANDRDGAELHYRLDAEGVEWSFAVAGESGHGRYAYGRVRAVVDVTSRGWMLLVLARSGPVVVFLKEQMDNAADVAALLKTRLGDRYVTYAGGRLKLPPEPDPA